MFLRPVGAVVLGSLLLTVLALFVKTSSIESDLTTRVVTELETKGYAWALVKLEGRNVVLEGTAPNDSFKKSAAEVADSVGGVFRVKSLMEVAVKTAEEIVPAPNSLPQTYLDQSDYNTMIKFDSRQIKLNGSVPSTQLKKEIVRLASEFLPGSKIIDDLTINSASPNNWRTVFGLGFSQLSRLKSGKMVLEANVVRLSGKAWSDASVVSITQILHAGLPDPYLAELSIEKSLPGTLVAKSKCQELIDDLKNNRRIYFDNDNVRIKRKSYALLDRLAYTLKRCPEHKIRIEGHTDNRGPGDRNWRLSKGRAESVKQFLVRSGLRQKRIYTRGYGEARPIATNLEPRGRAMNRRIELIVTNHKYVETKGSL